MDLWVEGTGYAGIVASRGGGLAPTSLEVEGCTLAGDTEVGVLAFDAGTELALVDARVWGTLPDGIRAFGYGISVKDGAALTVEGCEVAGNSALGVLAHDSGTPMAIRDSAVTGASPGPSQLGAAELRPYDWSGQVEGM